MPTRYRAAPLGGPARISARNHPTYEPGRNVLVCPFCVDHRLTRVIEMDNHLLTHTLTESQAREWLSLVGFKDWRQRSCS